MSRSRQTVADWQRTGREAALGRRQPLRRRLRQLVSLLVRVLVKLHTLIVSGRAEVGWLEYHPAARSASEHADLAGRAGWYLADIGLPVHTDGPSFSPDDAPWLEARYVERGGGPSTEPHGGLAERHRLLHRVTPMTTWQALTGRSPVTVVDPELYSLTDAAGYQRIRRDHGRRASASAMPARAAELIRLAMERPRTALVVATGPSAMELDLDRVRDYDVRITCNSAVRNPDFLEALQPTLIAFADPVFHLGPSRYAAAFREDVRRAAELTDALLLLPAHDAALLLHDLPGLADHLVPFEKEDRDWSWPDAPGASFRVRTTDNILPLAMLPAAFATATEIHIAGSDGRAPGERYFWRHNPHLQYSDELMDTVFTAHPAFFRDRMYADYYERHCGALESLLVHAEARSRIVRAITSSHIPALQVRGADRPANSDKGDT